MHHTEWVEFTSLEYIYIYVYIHIIVYTAYVAISKNAKVPCATMRCANSGIDGGKKNTAWHWKELDVGQRRNEDHKLQTDLQHDFMIESNSSDLC